jgi:uracil-DNA glycosylase
MIDLPQLQQSLYQTLEHLQRCGLQRIPRSVSQELAPKLHAFAASLRSPVPAETGAAIANQTSKLAPSPANTASLANTATPRPAAPPPAIQTTSAPTAPRSGPAAPPLQAAGKSPATGSLGTASPWDLPVLSLGERQTHLEALNSQIKSCRLCEDIVCYRQQTVPGAGPLHPTVCFMGEAPGADEDRRGVPFVGAAGQLLTKIIEAMQLKREEVYILNALKCRPPQNRTPVPEEIENCHPYAARQLDILQPKYIVCLGAVAVRSLLGSTLSVGSLRGRFHNYRQAKVLVTYHPSYLLRNESAKKLVWQDMQMLMKELGLKPPGKPK